MCSLKIIIINCIILIVIMHHSVVKGGSSSTNFKRDAKWLMRLAAETAKYRPSTRLLIGRRTTRLGKSDSGRKAYIPPVVNPPWDSTVPKFNAIIIKRNGDEEIPRCSGALISFSFVVTVGTGCVLMHTNRVYSPDDIAVRFLSHEPHTNEILAFEMGVKKIAMHEGCYKAGVYLGHNDIALIQLDDQLTYDDYIRPANITKRTILHHPAINEYWDLSNFRIFHLPESFNDAIWFVRTSFISTNVCDVIIPTRIYHKLQMTCASYYHAGSEDCSTDQGSPLSYKGELIGLLLYREHCGGPGTAALFINIGVQSNWIRKHVQIMSDGLEAV